MGPLQTMFNQRRLAIVPNVGPLIKPTTKAQYTAKSEPKPASLFSHNDQQNTWQALAPRAPRPAGAGAWATCWPAQQVHTLFTAVSGCGNAVWLSGQSVRQYQQSTGAVPAVGIANNRVFGSAESARR